MDDDKPLKYSQLISAFHEFFIVAIHKILYIYKIYPPTSFEQARYHGAVVHQNRHPAVKQWIEQMSVAVIEKVKDSSIKTISIVVIRESDRRPLERLTFDMSCFGVESKSRTTSTAVDFFLDEDNIPSTMIPSWNQIFEEYHACLVTLSNIPITVPEDQYPLAFTVALEQKDDFASTSSDLSVWMPASSSMDGHTEHEPQLSIPVRYLNLGAVSFNTWIQR